MGTDTPKVAVIGEVMVEFAPAGSGGCYHLGLAGDTFNTAVSLARLGVPAAYVTRLGDDPFSDKVLDVMREEGVDGTLVESIPGRQPGLYVVATTPDGERSFSYWRNESPARELWSSEPAAGKLEAALADYPTIYLSGITLAIMEVEARERMRQFLAEHRLRGGRVVFDSNYRPRLWDSADEARAAMGAFLELSDVALLTLEDEQALWGDVSVDDLVERNRQRGIVELVVKRGSASVLLWDGVDLSEIAVPPVQGVVDTTGAGDAFNAGYLAERFRGATLDKAVAKGNRAASAVIRQPGGIVDRSYFLREMAACD